MNHAITFVLQMDWIADNHYNENWSKQIYYYTLKIYCEVRFIEKQKTEEMFYEIDNYLMQLQSTANNVICVYMQWHLYFIFLFV